jgi:hypothetical protein
MYYPIPYTPLLGTVAGAVRTSSLRTPLARRHPVHYPLRHLTALPSSSTVWALVCIAVAASVLGLIILSTARRHTGRPVMPSRRRRAPIAAGHDERPSPSSRAT